MEHSHAAYSPSSHQRPTRSGSDGLDYGALPITAVVNENWRGKNDPTERRRIQNRLNQRAFRQRQREGQSPKQYKPRSMSGSVREESSDDEAEDDEDEDDDKSTDSSNSGSVVTPAAMSHRPLTYHDPRAVSAPAANQPRGVTDAKSGQVWDELAQLINRNLMQAAVHNTTALGIEATALQTGALIYTPRPSSRTSLPAALTPVELQYRVAHDSIIDIIPCARLRHNVLYAIANGQINATAFTRCIRGSGAMEQSNGSWQRSGMVVWSSPEHVGSWELSESFVRRWAPLLQGCEDLIAATNAWRSKRGERLFPLTIGRSDAASPH
ncbi:hypothetical protein LTR56_026309 [Elasticomyces elasticus]|nr:hypothetical protein LTR56_026309 [Elasticomyces elasticus]KAK3642587.1 hypothetical protein LTR22_016025 [Elasticomyces elasticus]KAK4903504.1 hypothetical protein LTR49_026869 [Elasticomyces elasticus]KAK5737288.1 hypothetical protein LTS12_025940 [Elasticomyces elasticus]